MTEDSLQWGQVRGLKEVLTGKVPEIEDTDDVEVAAVAVEESSSSEGQGSQTSMEGMKEVVEEAWEEAIGEGEEVQDGQEVVEVEAGEHWSRMVTGCWMMLQWMLSGKVSGCWTQLVMMILRRQTPRWWLWSLSGEQ